MGESGAERLLVFSPGYTVSAIETLVSPTLTGRATPVLVSTHEDVGEVEDEQDDE